MVSDFKILETQIDEFVVSEYLNDEAYYKVKNLSKFKTYAVASVLLTSTLTVQAIEPSKVICTEYDYSRTDLVKNQSDYLDYYIHKVNQFSSFHVLKEELVLEILSFKALNENWDGYGAIPLEVKSAANAISILNKLEPFDITKINEIYPNPHGTLTIEFENENYEKLHLEVGNESFSYFFELNSVGVSFNDDLSFANENVKTLIENIQSI